MTQSPSANVRFGHLTHLNRGLHTGRHTELFENILKAEGVHNSSQHSHIICLGAFYAKSFKLPSPEHITPSDHHSYLDAGAGNLNNFLSDPPDGVEIEAKPVVSRENLSGEL